MPTAWRWTFVGLIVIVALAVALWPRAAHENLPTTTATAMKVPAAVSGGQRSAAALADCPTATAPGPAKGPLAGIGLDCLANGRQVDLGAALAGKPALLNLWAYWCAPCAEELPALQQFADRVGSAMTVLTVHSDPNESMALARLQDLKVHLAGVEDGDGRVRTAVGAVPALPISVLVRADGSIAKVVSRPFADIADISAKVAAELGVRV
ncbi:TlpA disulfide reductase family protein [Nocardia macrotermitis]|uniref:TlpA disulfide reductase family protein n=1 Tax=Nocardia macrotermitis TaxID=2585198 RepID=UPI0029E7CD89|nr:TlpA disulfide reductase family protein [Nocardia macrotermitis]